MQYLNLTLPMPAENLALDEALLEEAEAAAAPREILRLWESPVPLVVVGRSSRVDDEVHVETCRAHGVPILRRPSGGAAIVAGPGCLMYALVLSYQQRPELRPVAHCHSFVLNVIAAALHCFCPEVRCAGTSDLVFGDRKFSGNSMRARRRNFLYHGTLLYQFPSEQIGHYLKTPPRTPAYRAGRDHAAFVTNLPLSREVLGNALIQAWAATDPRSDWPPASVTRLVAERYSQPEWNWKML
ncbi:MAG: lipoate--protein ligase family protein [Pirellulales bacterium]|nr:lipoate--protein ligase family protein [Pirellulales bacterium]